jgi:phage/plasmid primase-like uncharacterized protein
VSCEHRYRVEAVDGKGTIKCQRCGDIKEDGLNLDPKQKEAEEYARWQAKRQASPIWTPPGIA